MYVLGLNGGLRLGYQDVAAVLLKDGQVVAAIEEERLIRVKHAAGQLPDMSIRFVLAKAGITFNDIDLVATHGSTWGDGFEAVLREYLVHNYGTCPEIIRVHHHMAHAASAYYGSGFDESMILSMDASGDGIALQRAIGKAGKVDVIEQIPRTNSLGIFYSMMTQYCGFIRDTDEYKVMGLAPYGDPDKVNLDNILEILDGGYKFDQSFIKEMKPGHPQPTRQTPVFGSKLVNELGTQRQPRSPITQHYKDAAAATQRQLGRAIVEVVKAFHKETGLRKLCLGGGVALNCAVNQQLMNLDFIDEFFVQPASSDAGISLGAAYAGAVHAGDAPQPMKSAYWGSSYNNHQIKQQLDLFGLTYRTTDNPAKEAAKLVADNKVIGWFQYQSEFGPRALGARSILGNPQAAEMKDVINSKIKFRESYRPFCPSVLEEDAMQYFAGKQAIAPYMTINYDVKTPEIIPAATHVDQTARIQTVNENQNPLYYAYLNELKALTGHGVSINTSFNRNREPMVDAPMDAISCYFGSGLDALVIGDFVLEK